MIMHMNLHITKAQSIIVLDLNYYMVYPDIASNNKSD
jgi:hypothetical protein